MYRNTTQSEWLERARNVLPGGGLGNFDPEVFIREGKGANVWDEDGNKYVDYIIGSGPMLLGHGHPEVMEAVFEQLPKGQTFFAGNVLAVRLAEEIVDAVPCGETLRYVSTGGEADMYAIRAARAFTGRDKIVKFEGGYHGMSAEAQMSLAPVKMVNFPKAVPDSAGIPQSVADEMLIAPFNDFEYIRSLLSEYGDDIAGIIVEPLQRTIPPLPGFLRLLREECDKYGIVLVFDEIVTGFRLAYGGAQELYGVTPDLCTLGKIIGGGFPLAAITGKRDIMAHFDKAEVGAQRWLMQLGTLSGNPVASAAGLKTLEILRREGQFERLGKIGERLMACASNALDAHDIPHSVTGEPSLFDIVFSKGGIRNYRDVICSNTSRLATFNSELRKHGILKSPGKTYACLALTEEDILQTESAYRSAAETVAALH
ncbi:MAG: aminotransferase class III-fold pyridoxal phosphate-dependent enzyme [Roseovarius sp.]|nr:aminotransferase class III-fold pyridoxal phosphate-dependent enzyme [Roseovarius sp.]MCY4291614.1 aminotransferase class III-fold pyridoxal phosphate-dependent enzyme [Roseovarius sp.]